MEGDANAYLKTTSITPNETKVTWGMKGKSKYPMNIMNLVIDKLLGKDIDEGLVNLKTVLEK